MIKMHNNYSEINRELYIMKYKAKQSSINALSLLKYKCLKNLFKNLKLFTLQITLAMRLNSEGATASKVLSLKVSLIFIFDVSIYDIISLVLVLGMRRGSVVIKHGYGKMEN